MPFQGSSVSMMIFSRVVLPAPFSPTMQIRDCRAQVSLVGARICKLQEDRSVAAAGTCMVADRSTLEKITLLSSL